MKKDFLPIILGSDDNAYGTSRLIHEKYSIRPLMLCTRCLRATAYSNLCDVEIIPEFDSQEVFPGALREILIEKSNNYNKIVIIPFSDYYLYLLVNNYETFSGMIANKYIPKDLLKQIDTKDSFYELCEKYGLDYPKTVVVTKDNRSGALDSGKLKFPIIVKPENSNAYEYLHCEFPGKKKVFFFNNIDQYEEMVSSMNSIDYSGKLIIQEFIPGGDDAMRTINCYSDLNGKVRAACLGQPVLEEYSPKSLGNYAAIISRYDADIYNKVTDFLEGIGYVGFSNFDIKVDPDTGKFMFFEINPRLGRSSFFVHGTGLNMIEKMIDDIVYDKRYEPAYTAARALWTAVPKYVLMKYIKNDSIKEEIKELWREGRVERTLFYNKDMSFKRRITMWRHYYSYIISFRKYYFDKT